MKLCELDLSVEPRLLKQKPGELDYKAKIQAASKRRPEMLDPLGSGTFGDVYDLRKRTNAVIKVGKTFNEPKYDGYLSFVAAVQKYGKNNPYLPQIFDIKIRKVEGIRNVYYVYKVRMEKLIPSTSLSNEEWSLVLTKTFQMTPEELEERVSYGHYFFLDILESAIRGNAEGRTYVKRANRSFREAVTLIRYVTHRSNAAIDLGPSNVMVRRTLYGPQIVITDPLY